jgi:ATP-dependent Zn protease
VNAENSPQGPSQNLIATAYHEAGHAVVAISFGRRVKKVTIESANLPTGGVRLGAVQFLKGRSQPTDDWLEDEVVILLAGMVAESNFTGRYCEQGAAMDLRSVDRLLESRVRTERQLEKVRKRMISKTELLLSEEAFAKAVKTVADELLEKGAVSGRLVKHHLNQAIAQAK